METFCLRIEGTLYKVIRTNEDLWNTVWATSYELVVINNTDISAERIAKLRGEIRAHFKGAHEKICVLERVVPNMFLPDPFLFFDVLVLA